MNKKEKQIPPPGIRPETDREKIRELMSGINWDSNRDVLDYYDVLYGRLPEDAWFNRDQVLARLLMHMSWYKILRILPFEEMKDRINDKVIGYLWPESMKEHYAIFRRYLSGEALPLDGWGIENGLRLPFAFFSNRRYGP